MGTNIQLTVAICAHNSRKDLLEATLDSLQGQTMDKNQWELILIDNASSPALSEWVDLGWHNHAKIIVEPKLGLTPARLRAFKESSTDFLIMVDDDNKLDSNYLSVACEISEKNPTLGAWGASIEGQFEKEVPKWLKRELLFLAVRPIQQEQVALKTTPQFPTPAGAGMCLRRSIFEHYNDLLQNDTIRQGLDRKGSSLISAGDTDLSMCAWDLGYGLANFPSLKLTHLIPAGRMTIKYMRRLHESMAFSEYMLTHLRGEDPEQKRPKSIRVFKTILRESLKGNWQATSFFLSQLKGARKGHAHLKNILSSKPS